MQIVIENENVKEIWDFSIQTDRIFQVRRPDKIRMHRNNNIVTIIDIASLGDTRITDKEKVLRIIMIVIMIVMIIIIILIIIIIVMIIMIMIMKIMIMMIIIMMVIRIMIIIILKG